MDSLTINASQAAHRGLKHTLAQIGLLSAMLLLALMLSSCLADKNGKEGTAPPASNSGSSSLSFATDVEPILSSAGCTGCHGPTAPANACSGCHTDGRSPSSAYMNDLAYADMVSQPPPSGVSGTYIVDPGSSDTSVLYWVVTQDARYTYNGTSSSMLSLMNLLTSSEKSTVQNWIDQGAAQ